MYKLATDRRPKVGRAKVTFLQNQTEVNDVHGAFKPIRINFSYYNYTGGDITIIDRSNMKFTVKPLASGAARHQAGIMVVKNYIFHDTVILDELTLSDEMSQDQLMLRKAFANRIRTAPNETSVSLVYSLSPEAFREFDECVYISELDIVITRQANEVVVHPYSEAGKMLHGEPSAMNDSFSGFGFRWVTHNYRSETLYLNLCGMVVSVTSMTDLQMEEGFYVYVKGLEQEQSTRLVRMTLEEAIEKYKLTPSLMEAQSAMSIEDRLAQDVEYKKGERRLELLEKEHDLKLAHTSFQEKSLMSKIEEMERKYQNDRASFEMENVKRDREHEQMLTKYKLEAEKALRDMEAAREKLRQEEESNRRKDHYENRSYDRKDSSELIKWLPGIIVGMGILLPKLTS